MFKINKLKITGVPDKLAKNIMLRVLIKNFINPTFLFFALRLLYFIEKNIPYGKETI